MTISVKVEITSRLDKVAAATINNERTKILPIRKNKAGQEIVYIFGKQIELSAFGHIPQFTAPNQLSLPGLN